MITQGKWTVIKHDRQTFIGHGEIPVCNMYTLGIHDKIVLERARAIAMVPNMINVLTEITDYLKGNANVQNMIGPEYGIWHRAISVLDEIEGRE